ncbi:SDR family NAD(P)-dependent oxidoreductase [Arthrobacter sp. Sa2CUA1]|uniref:SDR family NAD(P)-dependent oxidoreductase n=1 Tax=Arthrobacter gallicola TaxID=2762225 RepID=A0ABR8UWJ8_9MICC|nr:SDR family NAD(P)-dependent oxidoreductase [Arthrobacter gallicola]MBD7996898.1 SDR family NAD(P)-dependent oxidoreductase [Arthrobacter gallicola]
MTDTAVVTGATSGLGAEFARQLAERGHNLVLTARDQERLEAKAAELSARYGVKVAVLPADLATPEGVEAVAARVAQPDVGILVNNAGYGLKDDFHINTAKAELDNLNVLVSAPLRLSHAAVNSMLARGGGRIINVASVAGFVPRGTYSAAKAWVISFSRWANLHYAARGLSATALCPGFVHTEFHERMQMDKSPFPGWMWLDAERVVREGLADAFAGKSISIPSKRYKILASIGRRGPQALVARVAARGR